MSDTNLGPLAPEDCYGDILHVANNNGGLTGGSGIIYDGNGLATSVAISQTGLTVNGIAMPLALGTNGQYVQLQGNQLVFATVSAGAGSLATLSDVTLSSPTNGQYLKYNGSNWINSALSGNVSSFTNDASYTTLAAVAGVGYLTANQTITLSGAVTGSGTTAITTTYSTVGVAVGGTGNTSTTAYAPICGGTTTTGAFQAATTGMSNSGYVLTSTGAGSMPTWQVAPGAGGGVNASTVTIISDSTNITSYLMFAEAASGNLALYSNTGAKFNPSTGVITATGFSGPLTGNVTGNCSGSSGSTTGNAATVTTNANLTGPITSVGNATSIASQTGTGTKFVVDTSPVLVTPTIGAATATSVNKVTITAPAIGSTLTIQDGFTLTVSGNATVSGTNTGDQTTVSGSSGSCTGNAATATKLAATKNIGGVAFDGSADITPNNITAANEAIDTTCFPAFFNDATGAVQPKTNASYTFNSSTVTLSCTNFVGSLSGASTSCSGNAATVTTNANLTGDVTSSGNATTYNNTVPVTKGGTGLISATAYAVLCGGTTSTGNYQSIASVGTANQVLTSNGAGALPTFQAASGGTSLGVVVAVAAQQFCA